MSCWCLVVEKGEFATGAIAGGGENSENKDEDECVCLCVSM